MNSCVTFLCLHAVYKRQLNNQKCVSVSGRRLLNEKVVVRLGGGNEKWILECG